MVVYSASASFPTLTDELRCSPGSTYAFRASLVSSLNGNSVVCVVVIVDPSGNATVLYAFPVIGKFSFGLTKCNVAPQSKIIVDVFSPCLISTLLSSLSSSS